MKILEFEVEGFRSLKHVIWKPGDLNVIIGPNGGGKSNVLRAFELLAASARGKLAETINAWGGLFPLLWNNKPQPISLRVRAQARPRTPVFEYRLEIEPIARGESFYVERETLLVGLLSATGALTRPKRLIEREGGKATIAREPGPLITLQGEALPIRESLLAAVAGSIDVHSLARRFAKQMAEIRAYQDWNVGPAAPVRGSSATSSAETLDANAGNLVAVLHTLMSRERAFKRDLDAAMGAAFPGEYEALHIAPAADLAVQLRIAWKSLEKPQPAGSLSDGTLRFLALITALLQPSVGGPLLIDEPETGLHPGMMRIVAEHAVQASRHTQLILTTHSPQFLAAFQDAVPTTTVVTSENGETKLRVLDPEKLRYWMKDYTLGDLFVSGELESMA